jgi:CheY-like chemotaxis protein
MKKILILEDDLVNQELLKLYLNGKFDVSVVSTFDEAIHLFLSQQFDLVITDIYLGNDSKSDGNDLLKTIREGTTNKAIPVVAYTAYDTIKNDTGYIFSSIISKPINMVDFINEIHRVLE